MELQSNKQTLPLPVMLLLPVLLAAFPYLRVLGYGMTSSDLPSLIEQASRAMEGGLWHLFSTPLFSSDTFQLQFYRPISLLSYWIDNQLWGVNPYGYHLTNLLLHMAVALMVALFALRVTAGNRWAALASAIVYALHPILVESVMGAARRQDLLAAFFLLAGLRLYLWPPVRGKVASQELGVLALMASFLSKESGLIGLPLLFLFSFDGEGSWRERLSRAVRASAVPTVIMLLLVAWRSHVLAMLPDLGGGAGFDLVYRVKTPLLFLDDLVYSGRLLAFLAPVQPTVLQTVVGSAVAVLMVWLLGRLVLRTRERFPASRWKGAGWIETGAWVALLLILLVFPLFSLIVSQRWAEAWRTEFKLRELYILGFSMVTIVAAGSSLVRRGNAFGALGRERRWVHLLWMAILLLLFVSTGKFSHRSMLLVVIPFALYLGLLLAPAFEALLTKKPSLAGLTLNRRAALLLAGGLLVCSPLFWPFSGWKVSGEANQLLLDRLAVLDREALPKVVEVTGFPEEQVGFQGAPVYALSASTLKPYAVQSWLNLNYGEGVVEGILEKSLYPHAQVQWAIESHQVGDTLRLEFVPNQLVSP